MQQSGNRTVGFGAQRRVDEVALRDVGHRGDELEMDLRHRPTGSDVFHGHRRDGIDLVGGIACRAQFIGQSNGKAARVGGCNQFGRVRSMPSPGLRTRGVRSPFQYITRSGHGPLAVGV